MLGAATILSAWSAWIFKAKSEDKTRQTESRNSALAVNKHVESLITNAIEAGVEIGKNNGQPNEIEKYIDITKYHYPAVAVDIIVEKDDKILLIRRKNEPFKGMLDGEKVEDAAVREMLEETNLNIKPTEILGVYSDPKRDPRGHVVNIVFIGKIIGGELKAGDDAEAFEWVSYEELKDKQFIKTIDHLKIMEDYQEWKKPRSYWSSR